MNKSELIAAAAEAAGMQKKDADRLLNAALDIITRQLSQGGKVQLSGFGTFECKDRQPRTGRNPHTRQAVSIPATRAPSFKPSKNLKEILEK